MKYGFIAVTTLIFFATTAWARYAVQPNRFEGSMPAGAAYSNEYTISNSLDTPLTLHVKWTDQTIDPLSDNWLQLSESKIILAGKEQKKLLFTITIPENATGEYNARVIFSPEPTPTRKGAMPLTIKYNLAIYMAVKGTEQYDFSVQKLEFTNDPAFQCTTTLFNDGNIHIRPTGSIKITSQDTGQEYTMQFNTSEWAFLPKTQYEYKDALDKTTLPEGIYAVHMTINAGNDDTTKSLMKDFKIQITGNDVSILEN